MTRIEESLLPLVSLAQAMLERYLKAPSLP